jgi:glycosyltransferase involved in cell wall biosynthesis
LEKKPRILIIENAIDITGGLISIVRSSQTLREHYDFFFVLPVESRATSFVSTYNFSVHIIPMAEIRKDLHALVSYLPLLTVNSIRLAKLINTLGIDMVVSNDFYNLIPSIYRCFGGRKLYVVFIRFLPSKFPTLLVRLWSIWHKSLAAKSIVVSQAVQNQLPYSRNVIRIGGELPEFKIPFSPPGTKQVLYLANYIKGKGQEFAIQSFARIAKRFPDWELHFVGSDMGLTKNLGYKEELKTLATKLGILDQIRIRDFSPNPTVEFLSAAFVLNFSESESFSLTCLEAMYHGRPVVATRCGGPSEFIDHMENGILVDIGDVNQMALSIEYMILNEVHRSKMAKGAYESIRVKFSFDETIARLDSVYRDVLKQ